MDILLLTGNECKQMFLPVEMQMTNKHGGRHWEIGTPELQALRRLRQNRPSAGKDGSSGNLPCGSVQRAFTANLENTSPSLTLLTSDPRRPAMPHLSLYSWGLKVNVLSEPEMSQYCFSKAETTWIPISSWPPNPWCCGVPTQWPLLCQTATKPWPRYPTDQAWNEH